MGHRFSKSSAAAVSVSTSTANVPKSAVNGASASVRNTNSNANTNRISIPGGGVAGAGCGPTINLQIQEESSTTSVTASRTAAPNLSNHNSSVTSTSTCPRQIIIKIQLAKMKNDNGEQQEHTTATTAACAFNAADANSNSLETTNGILNVTLNSNFTTAAATRTAGSSNASTSGLNNNFSPNSAAPEAAGQAYNALMGRINALHLHDEQQSTTESAEYCEVLEDVATTSSSSTLTQRQQMNEQLLEEQEFLCAEEIEADNNNCCRRKSKSSSKQQRRCCRCTCRDAIRRLLEPSSSSKSNSRSKELRKEQQKQQQQQQQQHSNIHSRKIEQARPPQPQPPTQQRHAASSPVLHNSTTPISIAAAAVATTMHNSYTPSAEAAIAVAASNQQPQQQQQFSVWGGTGSADVIIPISSPQQFVVVQCPPTSLVALGRVDNIIHLTAINHGDAAITSSNRVNSNAALVKATPNGPIVHSQVDFVHCLVPDLERITNASFYWGKMDRYEAERLLDGKPEGTFLLRDSAQEEFLFSVTFRKYGRSLHARIEQNGHKFSFDCHDPCVYNASTVTGLLEHYKDPTCVMFFEPMLTIPLHRKTTFSLQSLCRATIVSHTTYDGITELELPTGLKGYLKEYHYKHKLGTKHLGSGGDEPFYTCT